jgi:hypothetical protein
MTKGSLRDNWFAIRLKSGIFEGPFSTDRLREAILEKRIEWDDIGLRPGINYSWIRFGEVEELQDLGAMIPTDPAPFPPMEVLRHFRTVAFSQTGFTSKPVGEARVERPVQELLPRVSSDLEAAWHLLIDGVEYGPFSAAEIEGALERGRCTGPIYAWRPGMRRWRPLEKSQPLGQWRNADEDDRLMIEMGRNVRKSLRKSLVASVFLIPSSGSRRLIGVCDNITPEGLQFVRDQTEVPFPIGSRHRIEILPLKSASLPPFQVSGVVRWADPSAKTIGIEFERLHPNVERALRSHLKGE